MVHRILTVTDKNTCREKFAVIANYIDWASAFSRQDHCLGVKSFIKNGVRASLIPLLISYFQNRKMVVKHNGVYSTPRSLHGSGAQGATMGIL